MTSRDAARGAKASAGLGARIAERLDALAELTDEPGRLTRLYLGPAHRRAVDLVSEWMRVAGMSVVLDATGNVVGRYEGTDAGAPALLVGSHIDTVRDAGKFDGNLGVVLAIAAVAELHAARRRLPFAIEVIAFGDEEGVRFPSALGGSRAVAGLFEERMLDEKDADGVTRRAALESFGLRPKEIPAIARDHRRTLGFVEVHIEQGPVLEAEGLAVGIVTAINGASRGSIEISGDSGHAGTVPMALRRDALAAAAEIVLEIETIARGEADLVATVGQLDVPGGAVNTVPGRVRLSLDVRSPSDAARKAAAARIEQRARAIAGSRKLGIDIEIGYDASAAPCDSQLSDCLARVVEKRGVAPRRLPSGAGHDAMAFRGRLPVAMLFVRCRGGISHNPAEHCTPEDIDVAARVLLDFLDELADGVRPMGLTPSTAA